MKLRKAILLFIGLAMIAALVACSSSSSSSTPPPPTIAISATAGTPQSTQVGTAFATQLQATVTSNGSPDSGASVTFTAPSSSASCNFGNGTNTETDTTNSSGVATASVCTANTTTGSYSVAASTSGATSNATFSLSNTVVSSGTYVFSLAGLDTDDYALFYVAGAVTVSGGAITGGEQDYIDFENYGIQDQINPTGSSITTTADGNLQIVLTTCLATNCAETDSVVGVNGVETLNLTLRPSKPNQGSIIEFDSSGAAAGQWRLQNATAAAATPSAGYAFQLAGFDGGEIGDGTIYPLNIGGIINVDGVGTISGAGSIFDANDNSSGTTYQGETFAATSTVSAPDSFGRVIFTLNPTDTVDFPQIILVGYIVDSSRIDLVETSDTYLGTTGGIALSQGGNTGGFSSSSISGDTLAAAMNGFDGAGALQTAAEVTFNASGTVSGFIDFNDLSSTEPASPDPVSAPAYTVDATGRVTISGLTDSVSTTLNLQLYLDGNGNLVAVTLDTTDNQGASLGGQINTTGVTDANFTGTYVLTAWGWDGSETGIFGAVGPITATGTGDTFSGFTDINYFSTTTTTKPTADQANSGTYAVTANAGILSGTITGLDIDSSFVNADSFNYYQVDSSGTCVAIEVDKNQITYGFFQP